MDYTASQPSPEIFRLWAGISALAGAQERRTLVMSAGKPVYPNLYVLLVATPGIGKNIIQDVYNLWHEAKKFKVAPHSITKAGLMDTLSESGTSIVTGQELIEYHSLLVASPEFGVLVPAHDLDFLSSLNLIYDCPGVISERRRWSRDGNELVIVNPQITMFAGTQPGYLASLLPEEAWTMGWTSRLVMVHAGEGVSVTLNLEEVGTNGVYLTKSRSLWTGLIDRLAAIHEIRGQFKWTGEAIRLAETWYKAKMLPLPSHSKLLHYIPRRWLTTLKLCMVSSISRGDDLVLTADDFDRARSWLLAAEHVMPDIFREMTQRSDTQVIQELHQYVWRRFSKTNQPVDESFLYDFLQAKLPSEKISKLIEVAERSNFLTRDAGTKLYRPRPLHNRGVE